MTNFEKWKLSFNLTMLATILSESTSCSVCPARRDCEVVCDDEEEKECFITIMMWGNEEAEEE